MPIIDKIKNALLGFFFVIVICYVLFLLWVRGIDSNNIYSVGAVVFIIIMILLNFMKFLENRDFKFLWRIVFNLIIFLFIALVSFDQKLIQDCISEEQKTNFLIYTLIFLSIYFYLYKDRKIADCSYLSFSKILMVLSIILSLIHEMRETFVICLILLFYMNT
jgi:hypothetical protein